MVAQKGAREDVAVKDESKQVVPKLSRGIKDPRRRHKKVKTGCGTWIRRVKCDETKPTCRNCNSTGRQCEGYPNSSGPASSSRRTLEPSCAALDNGPASRLSFEQNMAAISIRNRLLDFPGSKDEHRSIDFFYCQTAPILSGYLDADFWSGMLPQIGCSEPCIQHAMIALASLQEHSDAEGPLTSSRNSQSRFALTQYNKSIKFLNRRLCAELPSPTTALICCILFVCIEFLRGNSDCALSHIDGGLAILQAQRSGSTTPPPVSGTPSIETHVEEIFSRLSIQNSLCGRTWSPLPPSAIPGPVIPYHFITLLEARKAITILMHSTHGFIRCCIPFKLTPTTPPPPGSIDKRNALLAQLDKWKSSFDIFLSEELGNFDKNELHASTILLILHLISKIWTATSMEVEETAWDAHVVDFETIVSLAGKLPGLKIDEELKAKARPAGPMLAKRCTLRDLFTFEMGAMPAVYFTALKCRDPVIRRRAIQVLAGMRPRREGLWDARQLEAIAKRVLEVEEGDGIRSEGCDGCDGLEWPAERNRVTDARLGTGYWEGRREQEVEFVTRSRGLDVEWEVWTEYIAW